MGASGMGWGCSCPWGSCLPTCFVFPSSPFMNKFFPANFPNRQYQLLFTQGSGENKEGQCCPLSLALGISHPLPLCLQYRGSSTKQGMEKVGSAITLPGFPPPLCHCLHCLHGGLWVNAFTPLSLGCFRFYFMCRMKMIHLVPPS